MRLRDKDAASHSLLWRITVIAVLVLVVGAQFTWGIGYAMSKQVSIVDGAQTIEVVTFANNVSEVLANQQITLQADDETVPAASDKLKDGDVITVHRAKTITLVDGKETYEKRTTKQTVQQVLEQNGVALGDGVAVNVPLDQGVTPNMVIEVTYHSEELVTQEELVPFQTENRASDQLERGVTQVAQEGANGVNELTYKVSYQNGDEVGRELISSTEKAAPVTRIVEYGTKESAPAVAYSGGGTTVSRSGEMRYKSVINVTATAYCLTGRTASGMYTQPGVVAVDPNVIPLGTRLYIEAPDGSWTYGNAVAADTGGAIKGNKIDLYMTTSSACYQFGRRPAKVYILE